MILILYHVIFISISATLMKLPPNLVSWQYTIASMPPHNRLTRTFGRSGGQRRRVAGDRGGDGDALPSNEGRPSSRAGEPYRQASGEGRPIGSGAPRDTLRVQADYGFTLSGKNTLRV